MNKMDKKIDYETLMNASLAANYVPFRTENESKIKKEDVFAQELWGKIFDFIQPRVVICISVLSFNGIKNVLKSKNYSETLPEKEEPIGWGKVTYSIMEFEKEGRNITLVRLPHLSRYRVFSENRNEECKEKIKQVTYKIANILDAESFK